MVTARVNGIDVYHEIHGSELCDVPWVLNIGGTGGDLRETFPASSPLNQNFRVLHYDQRGLGQTSKPAMSYSMEAYADDAAALIEELILPTGVDRCHVVGTSFGGMVALHLALRRSALVDRLALIVTSPGGDHASYRLTDLAAMSPDDALSTRMRLYDARWDPSSDDPIPGLGPIYDIVLERAQRTHPPEVTAGLERQLDARDRHDVVDRLGSIAHPTFVACGRFDGMAPVANSRVLAERMPNARMQVFDGGHLLGLQDRSMWPAVIDFLS